MTWKILSVAASAAMTLLGLFIAVTSSDAGSIRYGYVIAIIGSISTLLYSVQLIHARRRARSKTQRTNGDGDAVNTRFAGGTMYHYVLDFYDGTRS